MKEWAVKSGLSVKFNWRDPTPGGKNLGRAEFKICQIYKRGKLIEYFVYPFQQQMQEYFWHWVGESEDFTINSFEGLGNSWMWLSHWCKTHKTVAMNLYVPNNAVYLNLNYHGLGFTLNPWYTVFDNTMENI